MAAPSKAASVGSPVIFPAASARASLHRAIAADSISHGAPVPSASASFPSQYSFSTRIWLSVSVPVLSEQMTVTDPKVSTAGRRRTSAFCFAILSAPSASEIVTTAGRASGTAATARLTAVRSI